MMIIMTMIMAMTMTMTVRVNDEDDYEDDDDVDDEGDYYRSLPLPLYAIYHRLVCVMFKLAFMRF